MTVHERFASEWTTGRYRYYLVLLVLVLFGTGNVLARQASTITGTVVDAEDETALAGAAVVVAGTLYGAAADLDGRYTIASVPPGRYIVEVKMLGYRTANRSVFIRTGETLMINFRLQPEVVGLGGIEVTALRPDLHPTSELGAQRVRETHASDAGELMRVLPGVNAARRGALGFDPNVRGLSETEVGAYIDGVRFFPAGPLRMDSQISHFDPSSIARVEVVKGPYALTWGAGNMSAIRVERQGMNPAPGLQGTLQTGYNANVDAFETAGSVAGAASGWTYWLHGAYRTGDDYQSGDGTEIPSDYLSREIRGRLGYDVAPGARLSVSGGYHRQDDIDYPGRLLDADFFDAIDVSARYRLNRAVGVLRAFDAQVYLNAVEHGMDNDEKPTAEAGTFPNGNPRPPLIITVDAESQNLGGRVAADLEPQPGLTLTLGGDVYSARRDATRPFQAVTPNGPVVPPFYVSDEIWPDVTITDVGLFANGTRRLGAVTVSGTARLDVVQANANEDRVSEAYLNNVGTNDLGGSEVNLSGAVTLATQLAPEWSLSVGLGSVVRTADALERYADRFPASKAQTSAEFVGNPALDPERSTQADLWVEATYPQFGVNVNAFVRCMDDFITLAPTDISPMLPLSPEQVFQYVNGEATFAGFEAAAVFALAEALNLTLGGSYLYGEDTTLDEPALGVSPARADLGLRYDVPSGLFFVEGMVHLVAQQDRVATTRGEVETDGYTTADLRAGLRVIRNVSVLLGVNNLTDTDYVNHLNARNPFSGLALPEPGRVFFANARFSF